MCSGATVGSATTRLTPAQICERRMLRRRLARAANTHGAAAAPTPSPPSAASVSSPAVTRTVLALPPGSRVLSVTCENTTGATRVRLALSPGTQVPMKMLPPGTQVLATSLPPGTQVLMKCPPTTRRINEGPGGRVIALMTPRTPVGLARTDSASFLLGDDDGKNVRLHESFSVFHIPKGCVLRVVYPNGR